MKKNTTPYFGGYIYTLMLELLRSYFFNSYDDLVAIVIILLLIVFFVKFWKRKPMYVIEDDGILFSFINRKVLYSEITELRRIYRSELGIGMKMGISAPGANMGMFYFNSIGKAFMNSYDDNRMVLIATNDIQVIISPDNPDEFISQVRMLG